MALNDLRREQILDILEENREVQVARLAAHLQVSEMTIRRDLKLLEKRGRLKRVYGGAVATSAQAFDSVTSRATLNTDAKDAIASLAATLVEKQMRIFVNGGSTALALAKLLAYGATIQVTTNSIEAAQSIAAGAISDVTLLGGTLRRNAGTLIGPEVLEMIERRTFDITFLGIAAIHPHYGFLDPTEWHAYSARVLRQQSRKVVLLADHSKFEADSDIRSFEYREVDVLVTDRAPPDSHATALAEGEVEVLWPGRGAES